MMSLKSSKTPVIIGVGDVVNRSTKIEDAREPLDLILEAISNALEDTVSPSSSSSTTSHTDLKRNLQASIDSIDVVNPWTWPYDDLPGSIATQLQVELKHTYTSPNGGNQPAKLVDEAARRISTVENKVALVVGGEALASLTACMAAKKMPPPGWTKPTTKIHSVFSPTNRPLPDDLGAIHSIGAPIHVYPLFENAYRAHRNQSAQDNNKESADLYADFARVAATNEYAWNYGKPPATAETIGTVTKKNRMICSPYPLLVNAFNTINLAGAILLTSTEFAKELGIPENRWVYPLGGAGTQDSNNFWERPNYHTSPSISRSLDAGLRVSALNKDDVDFFDFYSCFPIVPKFAAHHLDLPLVGGAKPITLLGGLTSFGGAGNNYSMHAITALTRLLRPSSATQFSTRPLNGLVLANGGVATYQHVLCLSSRPRQDGSPYPSRNPLPEVITDIPTPSVDTNAQGEAVIETYTVEFARSPPNKPETGFVIGRLASNNHRFIANHADEQTLLRLASITDGEVVGLKGWVWPELTGDNGTKQRRNLFSLYKTSTDDDRKMEGNQMERNKAKL